MILLSKVDDVTMGTRSWSEARRGHGTRNAGSLKKPQKARKVILPLAPARGNQLC